MLRGQFQYTQVNIISIVYSKFAKGETCKISAIKLLFLYLYDFLDTNIMNKIFASLVATILGTADMVVLFYMKDNYIRIISLYLYDFSNLYIR